MNGINSRLL